MCEGTEGNRRAFRLFQGQTSTDPHHQVTRMRSGIKSPGRRSRQARMLRARDSSRTTSSVNIKRGAEKSLRPEVPRGSCFATATDVSSNIWANCMRWCILERLRRKGLLDSHRYLVRWRRKSADCIIPYRSAGTPVESRSRSSIPLQNRETSPHAG